MLRSFLLLLALVALPAHAGEVVNDEQVASCLEDNGGDATRCVAVLEAPCRHHARTGLTRACMFRLRERWERHLIAKGIAPLQPIELARWCPHLGGDARTESINRNRCRIVLLATKWAENGGGN